MEMLIVVAIIAITSALAAPAMHSAIMERKNNEAALDLVRLARRGRAEALAYGRAYVLRFDGTGDGDYRLYRGISSSCNGFANNWAVLMTGPCGGGGACVDQLSMSATEWVLGGSQIKSAEAGGTALVDICFEPRGTVEHRTDAAARFSAINNIAGGYVFEFERYGAGAPTGGVTRKVVVPLGSDARMMIQ